MLNQSMTLARTEFSRALATQAHSLSRKPLAELNVEELCLQRLSQSPYVALRHIACDFHQGIVTLRGTLPTYHAKQLAYATLRGVPGVTRVVDYTEVPVAAIGWTCRDQVN